MIFINRYSFRRFTMLGLMTLTAWVTDRSVEYAFAALAAGADWAGTVAILGALQAPIIGMTGYAYKLYNQSRTEEN